MMVTLTESGGFANIRRSCTLDTDALPGSVARRLERDCLAVLDSPPAIDDIAQRDVRLLTLEVVDADGRRSRALLETAATPELRSALSVLRPFLRIVPVVRS